MEKNEEYWNSLSKEERLKILKENDLWDGFSNYLWRYLPENEKKYLKQN